ncbi:MAG: hypothetical protein CM15mP120_22890 [Pseudomonadota bacterium]|nr:MAG: hypothetical protein CM15mP120_22890 [Pseudomonadota bacterium]
MQSKTLNWGYRSEPEPHMNGRRLDCPRGRALGGSSSINGMVYVRGHAQDYERGRHWVPRVGAMKTSYPILRRHRDPASGYK